MTPTELDALSIEQLEAAIAAKKAAMREPDYEAWRPALNAYYEGDPDYTGCAETPLDATDKATIKGLQAALPLAPQQPVAVPVDVEALENAREALRSLSDAAATAVHFQHQKTNAMLELSTEVKRARAALASITDAKGGAK